MKIKVLWIDDNYKNQLDLISDAELDGLDLIPFESHEEGMEALLSDLSGFHAVILDAKVKEVKNDTVTSLRGLKASRDRLIEINNQGTFLPYFIFTGQPDYMNNNDFRDSYGDFFVKGIDNQKLFDSIKEAVTNKEEYIIQREHRQVFAICNKYFDVDIKQILTEILKNIRVTNPSFNNELYYTQLRIILEKVFRELNRIGLLHDKCIKGGKVNLSESSLFLAGETTKHLNVWNNKPHFSKITADAVKNLIFITGAASHTSNSEKDQNIDIQAYKNLIKTPYLLYSLTYQLLDLIIWFDAYIKNNNDYQKNVSLWRENKSTNGDWITGTVSRIDNKGWGTFQPENSHKSFGILPTMVSKYHLKVNDSIKIITEPSPDGTKTYIKEISK